MESAAAVAAVDEVLADVTRSWRRRRVIPPELLDPELDLEADLGVDTVKQAEVFTAVREHYGVERDENLQLRDFPTLTRWRGGCGRPRSRSRRCCSRRAAAARTMDTRTVELPTGPLLMRCWLS